MSNSIWKMPEETPKDFCDVVLANSRTGSCCVFLSPFHNVSFHYDRWCYLTDLIAQVDKVERLQKAVDYALDTLKKAETTRELTVKGHYVHAISLDELHSALKEIKQLTQGE